MKNFFWFIHRPADEREQHLFNLAYQRALGTLWLGLSFIVVLLWVLPLAPSNNYLLIITSFLLLASYVSGWLTIRKEDLSFLREEEKNLKASSFILAIIIVLTLGTFYMYSLFDYPTKYIAIAGFMTFVPLQIILTVWSWLSTRFWNKHVRILISVIFPIWGIAFAYYKNWSLTKKIAIAAFYNILPFIIVFMWAIGLKSFIGEKVLVGTTIFEPSLKKGEIVMINKKDKNYLPKDIIVIKDEKGLILGEILDLTEDFLTIKTSEGIKEVKLTDILGKIDIP